MTGPTGGHGCSASAVCRPEQLDQHQRRARCGDAGQLVEHGVGRRRGGPRAGDCGVARKNVPRHSASGTAPAPGPCWSGAGERRRGGPAGCPATRRGGGRTGRAPRTGRDARPIAKGRLGCLVEFGYKGQVVDDDGMVVVDHTIERGSPTDAPPLATANRPGHPQRSTRTCTWTWSIPTPRAGSCPDPVRAILGPGSRASRTSTSSPALDPAGRST
jgi:hypothetical protein